MRRGNLMAGFMVGSALLMGCESNKEHSASPAPEQKKIEIAKPADDKAAKEAAAVAKAAYHEVKHHGRIYVLASQENAVKAAKGSHPQLALTKIGYGPQGETVVVEASEGGGVEKKLLAAFDTKYKIK